MSEDTLLLGPLVGGLAHDRAVLWGRASRPKNGSQILHAWLGFEPDLSDARLAGKSSPLRPEDGYAGIVALRGLTPDTRYHYALRLSDKPPTSGFGPLRSGPYPTFRTFPLPGERTSFSFAFGSCFRPKNANGGQIFRALEARRLEDDLRFILLLGDQIYADDFKTNSLRKVAQTLDEYRAVYAYVWSRPAFRQLLFSLPVFMTLDDHEVDDDWRWLDRERRKAYIPWWDRLTRLLEGRPFSEGQIPLKRVQDALQAYWEHQGMHAPPLESSLQRNLAGQYTLSTADPGSLAYTFEYGAAAFFVMDTRSMRVRGKGEKTMLGEGQWKALQDWLMAVKDAYPVKFLVTSCSLLFWMWVDIARDRWSGFSGERDRLLHFLAANGIEGVYFLSGDMHSAHAIQAELYGPQGRPLPIWEFCSSPFEQKPNRLALHTRLPIRSGLFAGQRCEFIIDKLNFGVVKVSFEGEAVPRVRFELFGAGGELLGQAGD